MLNNTTQLPIQANKCTAKAALLAVQNQVGYDITANGQALHREYRGVRGGIIIVDNQFMAINAAHPPPQAYSHVEGTMLWVKVPFKIKQLAPNDAPNYHLQALAFIKTVLGNSDCDPDFINTLAAPIYKPKFSFDYFTIPTGHHGIHNSGLACYMNSLLQMLYHCPEFRKALAEEQVAQENFYAPNYQCRKSVLCKLNMLFKKLDHSNVPAADVVDLLVTLANRDPKTDYIRGGNLGTGDPDEAVMHLLRCLDRELEAIYHQPMRFSRFSDIFQIVGYNHTVCNVNNHPQKYQAYDFNGLKCSFPNNQVALPMNQIPLPIGNFTLPNLVRPELVARTPVIPQSHLKRGLCVLKEHRITRHLPPYLLIKLARNVGAAQPAANQVTFPVA